MFDLRSLALRVLPLLAVLSGPAPADSPDDPATAPAPGPVPAGPIPCVPRPPTVIHYTPTVSLLPSPFGFVPYAPPLIVSSGPAGPWVTVPPALPSPPVLPGPIAPPTPIFTGPAPGPGAGAGAVGPRVVGPGQGAGLPPLPRRAEPRRGIAAGLSDRARELLTFGDRNFRADDLRRAERRYRQAMGVSPLSAEPRAKLSQVALARGEYREAAGWLREAITAEPDWLLLARDVQALYAEPSHFHDVLAALEAHLQAEPEDHDAWLVLGAQLLLSDRPRRAADVVLRLDDQRPDALLAALRDAIGVDR